MAYARDKHLAAMHALSAFREICIAWHRDPSPLSIAAVHGVQELLQSYLVDAYIKEDRASEA